MLKCLIYVQKTLKMDKSGNISITVFAKNANNSDLSVKFSSTLILKISWKNIKKCKSLSVLRKRILRKNAN